LVRSYQITGLPKEGGKPWEREARLKSSWQGVAVRRPSLLLCFDDRAACKHASEYGWYVDLSKSQGTQPQFVVMPLMPILGNGRVCPWRTVKCGRGSRARGCDLHGLSCSHPEPQVLLLPGLDPWPLLSLLRTERVARIQQTKSSPGRCSRRAAPRPRDASGDRHAALL
jgi:hypothetical protein